MKIEVEVERRRYGVDGGKSFCETAQFSKSKKPAKRNFQLQLSYDYLPKIRGERGCFNNCNPMIDPIKSYCPCFRVLLALITILDPLIKAKSTSRAIFRPSGI